MLGISSRLDQMFVKEKLESFAIFYPSLITEVGVKDVHEFAKISIFLSFHQQKFQKMLIVLPRHLSIGISIVFSHVLFSFSILDTI